MSDINVYYTVTYVKAGPGLNLGSLMIAHDTRCEARMRGAVSPHRPGKSYFARNRIGLTNIKLNGSPGGADRAPSRRHRSRRSSKRDILPRLILHSIPPRSLNATSRPTRSLRRRSPWES